MSDSGIERLSQLINPDTCGILWLTDDVLTYDSPGAYEINYLLNGILTKTLANEEGAGARERGATFFLGENFGKPFFVGHTLIEEKKDFQKVFKSMETASPFFAAGSQIYILNKSKNTANLNVLKELKNKYKDVNFEHLNI